MTRNQRNPEREAEIARRFRAGDTMEAIGASFDPPLCRERVRQLLKRQGVTRSEGGRAERTRQQGGTVTEIARQRAARRFLPVYGCTRAEARALNGGIGLDVTGSAARCFVDQRSQALTRDVGWGLTFSQWLEAWRASGHFEQRGRRRGGYVMTRHRFARGFEPGNVRICTFSEMSVAANAKRWGAAA